MRGLGCEKNWKEGRKKRREEGRKEGGKEVEDDGQRRRRSVLLRKIEEKKGGKTNKRSPQTKQRVLIHIETVKHRKSEVRIVYRPL